jgi:hypothetical protein
MGWRVSMYLCSVDERLGTGRCGIEDWLAYSGPLEDSETDVARVDVELKED